MKIRINSTAADSQHKHVWYYFYVGCVFEAVYETDPKVTNNGKIKGIVRITDKAICGRKFATTDVYDIVDDEYLPKELFETLD